MTMCTDMNRLQALSLCATGRNQAVCSSRSLPRQIIEGAPAVRDVFGAVRSGQRNEWCRKLVWNSAPTSLIGLERDGRTSASLAPEPDVEVESVDAAEEILRSQEEVEIGESPAPAAPAVNGLNAELSARDRRKLRHEKRSATKESREQLREEIDVVLTRRVKSAKKIPIDQQKDLSALTALGPQWYLVSIGNKGELAILEEIKGAVRKQFSDVEIEMFYPMVPARELTRRGSISSVPIKLTPGIAYLRTTMSNELHAFFKRMDAVRGFYGKRVGHLEDFMVVPEVVKDSQVAEVQARMENGRREFEVWQKEVIRQKEEELNERSANFPTVGSLVRVAARGVFHTCEGHVSKVDSKKWKVTALLQTGGGSMAVELGEDEFEVVQR